MTLGRKMKHKETTLVIHSIFLSVLRQRRLLRLIEQKLPNACPLSKRAMPTVETKQSRSDGVGESGRKESVLREQVQIL